MEISLKEIIFENRNEFNKYYFIAKSRFPSLEIDEFSHYLNFYLEPIVNKFNTSPKENMLNFITKGYNSILEFLGKFIIGKKSKFPEFENIYNNFYFNNQKNTFNYPNFYFSYLPNAILNLSRLSDFNFKVWVLNYSNTITKLKSEEEFLYSGFILAWKNGKSIWRETSLEYLKKSNLEFINLIFNSEFKESEKLSFLSYLEENPWRDPNSFGKKKTNSISIKKFGSFIGLKGQFTNPPSFYLNYPDLLTDGENVFKVHSDFFGVTLEKLNSENIPKKKYIEQSSLKASVKLNMITLNGKLHKLPTFPEPKAEVKTNTNSFYIVSPYSFSFLVGGISI
ncbi:MAG: hypothetical protein KDK36_04115 [Leptospiraceae bacterium]|nr:hypothetical protein [Leptospiraceae bacterium]